MHLLTRQRLVLLLTPSILLIALVWTIPHHDLLLKHFTVERVGALEILEKQKGPLYFPIFLTLQRAFTGATCRNRLPPQPVAGTGGPRPVDGSLQPPIHERCARARSAPLGAHRSERHQHPLSILMIEIDDFKLFNDAFGHDAGDFTLKRVAGLIQANTRTDDIPCRFGGDEFILILPETPLESASQCGESLRKNCRLTPTGIRSQTP